MLSACAIIAALAGSAPAGEPATSLPEVVELSVVPRDVVLQGANRRQQLLVTAATADGQLRDVTQLAEIRSADPGVARPGPTGSVDGVSDGRTELAVRFGGREATVGVQVAGFAAYPAVDFRNDVVPLLTRHGCNSGGCHGKASGQNGFKLSVFGFDPRADYNAIVKEARGRRVFPAAPERSLLLAKPSGELPHGGGARLQPGSREHELLRQWLTQGMPWGRADGPRIARLEVEPADRVLRFDARQQILVTAVMSDGGRRDVTAAAVFSSNAPLVAEAEETGVVHTGRVPGEAAVTVSFLEQVAVVRLQVPRSEGSSADADWPVHNRIDALVWDKLRKMRIAPSELCDDATFIRRVYVDAIGTLPDVAAVRAFLADADPAKREKLIDRVLAQDEYADYWALKWADVLLVDRKTLGERGAYEFHRWLRQQFADNRPYDQWVRELLTASGDSARVGPVNFFRAVRTPEELGRSVSQAFLGVRVECAQCHHHPWERWAREDFYGMAGFFNGLQRRALGEEREVVFHAGHRPMKIPVSGEAVETRPLGGEAPADLAHGDPRAALARWLTAPENPWFARLVANRLWKHYLGRGLVEPEDDLRSTNPPVNEPLLDHLADVLVRSGFDLKALTREILSSRVYQFSSTPNESNRDDEQNFSRYYKKRLEAEVLLDAIRHVTGVGESYPGCPPGTRAIELWDNRMPSYFLEIFGRPQRNSPCECGRSSEPTMAQALHLMNSPDVEAKISDPAGRVARLVDGGAEPGEIVEQLCLAALGRPPGEKEHRVAERLFASAPRRQAAEDFLWTLLNSYDFLFVQ